MADCSKRVLDFSNFPSWFKPEPGFRFRDSEGCRCIVIGEGGWRRTETVSLRAGDYRIGTIEQIQFQPWTLVIAFNYKGEWHVADGFVYERNFSSKWKEGWEE